MTPVKYTIFVGTAVVFITDSRQDALCVVNHLQQIQELTYGLNGYTFSVEILEAQETTPNYSRKPGYLRK